MRAAFVLSLMLVVVACKETPSVSPAERTPVASPRVAANATAETMTPIASAASREVVLGERVGAIDASTDEAALKRIYGDPNVKRGDWHLGEGETRPGTVLFDGTEDEVRIVWRDDAFRVPESIRIIGRAWRTAGGLGVGTSLADLVRINGGSIAFYGFEWDYGGTVASWERGALAKAPGTGVVLTRDYDVQIDDALDRATIGDQLVSSDLRGLEAMRIRVNSIVLDLGDKAE